MIRIPKPTRENTWLAILFFIALSFTWSERLSSVGIILLSIHWLIDKNIRTKIKSFQIKAFTIWCWLFFLLYVVASIWSSQAQLALQTVVVKLSFLVLPLLLTSENYLEEKSKDALFKTFAISLCLSFSYSFAADLFHNFAKGKNVYLNRMQISEAIMHPGYYSNYFAFALAWCGIELSKYRTKSKYELLYLSALFALLLIALLLLISKTAILFLGILILVLLWKFLDVIQKILPRIMLYVFSLLVLMVIAIQIPTIKYRIHETQNDTGTISKEVSMMNSTGSRITAWQNSWKLIQENWLWGYGSGSANSVLKQKLLHEGYITLANENMHTHNQLLHTWLDVGILGILLIVLIWISSTLQFIYQKNELALWLIVLMILNLMTDDMLEIQAGIVFFTFFICLFMYNKPRVRSAA